MASKWKIIGFGAVVVTLIGCGLITAVGVGIAQNLTDKKSAIKKAEEAGVILSKSEMDRRSKPDGTDASVVVESLRKSLVADKRLETLMVNEITRELRSATYYSLPRAERDPWFLSSIEVQMASFSTDDAIRAIAPMTDLIEKHRTESSSPPKKDLSFQESIKLPALQRFYITLAQRSAEAGKKETALRMLRASLLLGIFMGTDTMLDYRPRNLFVSRSQRPILKKIFGAGNLTFTEQALWQEVAALTARPLNYQLAISRVVQSDLTYLQPEPKAGEKVKSSGRTFENIAISELLKAYSVSFKPLKAEPTSIDAVGKVIKQVNEELGKSNVLVRKTLRSYQLSDPTNAEYAAIAQADVMKLALNLALNKGAGQPGRDTDGKPVRIKKVSGGTLVYSVGMDKKDSEGVQSNPADIKVGSKRTDDFGILVPLK